MTSKSKDPLHRYHYVLGDGKNSPEVEVAEQGTPILSGSSNGSTRLGVIG